MPPRPRVTTDAIPVRVSAAQLRQPFNGCEPDYIRDVCHGACCRSSTGPAQVVLLPAEVAVVRRYGADTTGLRIDADARGRCPFQHDASNLCTLHDTDAKPFGCSVSPFILTNPRPPTLPCLVVRNRYRLLKCYDDGRRLPAYLAFAASLEYLFGVDTADALTRLLDAGDNADAEAAPWPMLRGAYNALAGNAHERSHP